MGWPEANKMEKGITHQHTNRASPMTDQVVC